MARLASSVAGLVSAVLGLLGVACSSPELEGTRFACSSDTDCGSGQICADFNGASACQPAAEVPIRIGMSAPLQGPSAALGIEMRRGIGAMLRRFNESGGVNGRQVVLEARNDNYDPDTALSVMHELLDVEQVVAEEDQPDVRGKNGVFALVGNVGTPTVLRTAPVATKNKVIFFGPFTGAQTYLRDDTNSPYVYNYRAGYADETAAMIDYIRGTRIPRIINDPAQDYRRILVFAQEDTYGDSGYTGVVNAYNESVGPLPSPTAIARVNYKRDNISSVDPTIVEASAYLERVLADNPGNSVQSVAVMMIDTYQMGNRFIRGVKDWINGDATRAARLDVLFMNVSFVGGDALSEALRATPEAYPDIRSPGTRRSYAENVIVTQVVPNYDSQAPGVVQYREDIRKFDSGVYSFTSLEGYIVARLFTTALSLHGTDLTTEGFLQTLDTRVKDLDIGIGTTLNFSSTNHQASTTVWGSHIQDDGSFTVPFIWKRESGIQGN